MSARFPALEFDNEMGSGLENEMTKLFGPEAGFQWKDDQGISIGPFAVLAYTSDIFPAYLTLLHAVMQQKGLGTLGRELACLAVTAIYDAPFVRYAHERIAVKVGLSQEQVAAAVKGDTPDGLGDVDVVVYETALKLARNRGPLDQESWQVAEQKLGKEGAARVAHVVAWFVYNCTLLNLGAVDAPSEDINDAV